MLKKLVLTIIGLLLIVLAARHLSLLYSGDMTQAVIDQASLKKVKAQTIGGRHSIAKFTGLYILKTRVKYHFDVYPTPAEALQRGSEAPIQNGIKGCDVLSDLSSYKDPKYHKGDKITILYLKTLPQINAANQPNNLRFYGFSELIIGVLLVTWGILARKSSPGSNVDEESELDETDQE